MLNSAANPMVDVPWPTGHGIRVSPSLFNENCHISLVRPGTALVRGVLHLLEVSRPGISYSKFNGGSNGVHELIIRTRHPCLPIPFVMTMTLCALLLRYGGVFRACERRLV
jgi:hypothetical protein